MNLADFTRRAYGTNYMETVRITINANCRLRNVYFSDRLYADEEKPASFKIQACQPKEKEPAKKAQEEKVVETFRPPSPATIEPQNLDQNL